MKTSLEKIIEKTEKAIENLNKAGEIFEKLNRELKERTENTLKIVNENLKA